MHGEALELAASELVTNAVLHAQSPPTIRLSVEGDRLRLEVTDASPVVPKRKHYGAEAATGRGMLLVESLSEKWGTYTNDSGKTVWCEFSFCRVDAPSRRDAMR